MVCYDGFRIVTNVTKDEFREIFEQGNVDWFIVHGKHRQREFNTAQVKEIYRRKGIGLDKP